MPPGRPTATSAASTGSRPAAPPECSWRDGNLSGRGPTRPRRVPRPAPFAAEQFFPTACAFAGRSSLEVGAGVAGNDHWAGTLIPEQAKTHEEHGYAVRLNFPPFTVAAYKTRFVGHWQCLA